MNFLRIEVLFCVKRITRKDSQLYGNYSKFVSISIDMQKFTFPKFSKIFVLDTKDRFVSLR